LKPRQDLPETFLVGCAAHLTLLTPLQAGNDQQGKQNTDNERNDPMPTRL